MIAIVLTSFHNAHAQESKVFSISPASVKQGDTVLLTVKGKNLPTGTVVVEFFPQQIAVLNIMSAEKDELIIQVKVPNMAPPGTYNILIYNHLGQESFGEAALIVGSDLITPIFEEYDPKTISDAAGGFAVMMTGTLITKAAVDQLEMAWYMGDELVKGFKTEFAMAGASTVVCAVTGDLTGGVLRGRILLNKTPIYMVEIEMQLDRALLIGLTPSVVAMNQAPYKIKLLGMGVSEPYVESLTVGLKSEVVSASADAIEYLDDTSIMLTFPGPLPAGEYVLEVTAGGEPEYGGMITIADDGTTEESSETVEGTLEDTPPLEDETVTDEIEATGVSGEDIDVTTEAVVDPPELPGKIETLLQSELTPGDSPIRLDINCSNMDGEVFERLEAKLRVGMDTAELMLVSAGVGSYTYVFSPDANGWLEGETGVLEISDPKGMIATYSTVVSVKNTAPPVGPAIEEQLLLPSEGWEVLGAMVSGQASSTQLVVNIIPPLESTNLGNIVCSYIILPQEPGIEDFFTGLNLKGELALSKQPNGSVVGSAEGSFVDGDLLVKITEEGGASWLSTLPLVTPGISVSVTNPEANSIQVNSKSGSVDPGWLRWECRFDGVSPINAESLSLISSKELPGAEVLKVLLPDGGIALEIEFAGLAEELTALSQLEFWITSRQPLKWDKPSKISLEVVNSEIPSSSTNLTIQSEPVVLSPTGFQVNYRIDEDSVHSQLTNKVEASSGMLLFDWNLSGFGIRTELISIPTGSLLIVTFIRDKNKLDDTTFNHLCDELAASGMVELRLIWPEFGFSDSSQVQFEK